MKILPSSLIFAHSFHPMQQGSITVTRFWFTNGMDYKIRPAIIVSNEKFNYTHEYYLMIPLTTQLSIPDYLISFPENETAPVEKASFIRTDQITPIQKERVLKTLGKISNSTLQLILAKLGTNF